MDAYTACGIFKYLMNRVTRNSVDWKQSIFLDELFRGQSNCLEPKDGGRAGMEQYCHG